VQFGYVAIMGEDCCTLIMNPPFGKTSIDSEKNSKDSRLDQQTQTGIHAEGNGVLLVRLVENSSDTSRHETRSITGNHGAENELGKLGALVGSHRSQST
jgi:hypothetical protein